MTEIIPYEKAKTEVTKYLKNKDVKDAEKFLATCTDETRLRIYDEVSPQELGLLSSRGDLGWIICELSKEKLLQALSHDPELRDEKGQLYPVQAMTLAFSLSDRGDAADLYQKDDLIKNIVSLAFLLELPAEIEIDESDEIKKWLTSHWLNRFEPDIADLIRYDEESLCALTEHIREQAREEIRMLQRAVEERAKKVEEEMFDI